MEFKKKLRQIAVMMNQVSESKLPINKKILECFEIMINENDADFLLELGTEKILLDDFKRRSRFKDEHFERSLKNVLSKGLVYKYKTNNGTYLQIGTILPGWFEFVLLDGKIDARKKEFIQKLNSLFSLKEKLNIMPIRLLINNKLKKENNNPNFKIITTNVAQEKREIKINKQIPTKENEIYLPEMVSEWINKISEKTVFVLAHCFCRILRKEVGEPCRFNMPLEACIVVGNIANQCIEAGIGRVISKEEALSVVNECSKKGAIHTIFFERDNIENPEFAICNCCLDCCAMYGTYNRGGLTGLNYKSYYIAKVENPESCIQCGICNKYCPTDAISIKYSKISIDNDLCIGCGQCASKCPKNVLLMETNERNVLILGRSKSKRRVR